MALCVCDWLGKVGLVARLFFITIALILARQIPNVSTDRYATSRVSYDQECVIDADYRYNMSCFKCMSFVPSLLKIVLTFTQLLSNVIMIHLLKLNYQCITITANLNIVYIYP